MAAVGLAAGAVACYKKCNGATGTDAAKRARAAPPPANHVANAAFLNGADTDEAGYVVPSHTQVGLYDEGKVRRLSGLGGGGGGSSTDGSAAPIEYATIDTLRPPRAGEAGGGGPGGALYDAVDDADADGFDSHAYEAMEDDQSQQQQRQQQQRHVYANTVLPTLGPGDPVQTAGDNYSSLENPTVYDSQQVDWAV